MDAERRLAASQDHAPLPPGHRGVARSAWLRSWLWCEQAWNEFLFLVLPADCVGCGRADQSLCRACSAELRKQTARPFRAEMLADSLVGVSGESYVPVIAAGEYRDALAATILGFKNHGRTELADPLCRGLARVLEQALEQLPGMVLPGSSGQGAIWLVPIPSTGAGWRRRGYDPVGLIVHSLLKENRLPQQFSVQHLLGIKTKLPWRRRHQKGLGRAARRRNVRNTMKIKRSGRRKFRLLAKPTGQSVLLLDDVLTTGSTLQEAAKTLQTSGFNVLGAVVLAAARAPAGSTDFAPSQRLAENTFRAKDE